MQQSSAPPAGERSAAEVCQVLDLDPESLALMAEGMTVADFVKALIADERQPDAVQVLSQALPKPDAVKWVCDCLREGLGDAPSEDAIACLDAAEQWVAKPVEEARVEALAVAQATDMSEPPSFAALAAGMSGGSIAPPDLPEVPPAEELTGKMVAGALLMAAPTAGPGASPEENLQAFLAKGAEIGGITLEPAA